MKSEPKNDLVEAAWLKKIRERAAFFTDMTELFRAGQYAEFRSKLEVLSPIDAANTALAVFHRLTSFGSDSGGDEMSAKFSSWMGKTSRSREQHGKFCCEMMDMKLRETCPTHGKNCPDVVVARLAEGPAAGSIGIPIHDGGSSVIVINYCPWCGTKLKTGDAP